MLAEILAKISEENIIFSVDSFVKAYGFWKEFFETHSDENEDELAQSLANNQSDFEYAFSQSDDRYFAKIMMAPTAINYLYSQSPDGFARVYNGEYSNPELVELAKKTLRAFAKSKVSGECKRRLNEVACAFGLPEDEKYKEVL